MTLVRARICDGNDWIASSAFGDPRNDMMGAEDGCRGGWHSPR